jgi:hypothetical protein
MRAPLNALKPYAVKEAQSERERLASVHFHADRLRDAVSEAARRGELAVKLPHGEIVIELRGTEAADKLAEWVERNGMRLEWAERHIERPNGLKVKIGEPIISWGDEAYSLG